MHIYLLFSSKLVEKRAKKFYLSGFLNGAQGPKEMESILQENCAVSLVKKPDVNDSDSAGKNLGGEAYPRNLQHLKDADGLIAVMTEDSRVTQAIEVFYNSYVLGKPTYVVSNDKFFYEHSWIRILADGVFDSLEAFQREYVCGNLESVRRKIIDPSMLPANKEFNDRFYLAHATFDKEEIRKKQYLLENNLGKRLINPFYEIEGKIVQSVYGDEKERSIMENDLRAINDSEGLLALVTESRQVGTFMEIFYSYNLLNKPTYVIIAGDNVLGKEWLKSNSTKTFDSVESFQNWFNANYKRY